MLASPVTNPARRNLVFTIYRWCGPPFIQRCIPSGMSEDEHFIIFIISGITAAVYYVWEWKNWLCDARYPILFMVPVHTSENVVAIKHTLLFRPLKYEDFVYWSIANNLMYCICQQFFCYHRMILFFSSYRKSNKTMNILVQEYLLRHLLANIQRW